MFKNSKLLHLFIPPEKKLCVAPYVHCAAHCVNLITQRSCTASIFIRNSLDWVNELGVLFGQSGKLKDIFKGIARSEEGEGPCHTIRPLCPTRWTVRTSAICTVLNQYECIIKALSEMAVSESDAASKAQGLYEISEGKCYPWYCVCFGDHRGVGGFEYVPPEQDTDPRWYAFSSCLC